MTLFKLKSAPIVLLEDDGSKNLLPLLKELSQHEQNSLHIFCYEQPVSLWKNVFKDRSDTLYHEEFNPDLINKYTSVKSSVIIDSVNQMALCLHWNQCLHYVKQLHMSPNISQLILILHKDCLSHYSKLEIHLNHIANAVVSYDPLDPFKVSVLVKKGGKLLKREEILSYDNKNSLLKLTPILKEGKKEKEPEKPLPSDLTTFKIEVEQTEKLEKYKLKLPYMSKINEGESKVYYEPDAVDDWDEEDPDEDLDI